MEEGSVKVLFDGRSVEDVLASSVVAEETSRMAADAEACAIALRSTQQLLNRYERLVADGRSAGTGLMPDADLKFYIDAEVGVRARRRCEDLQARGFKVSLLETAQSLRIRDERDRRRPFDPLRVPAGAIRLDTSHRTIEESVLWMRDLAVSRGLRI